MQIKGLKKLIQSPFSRAVKAADAARDGRNWREAAHCYEQALELAPTRADIWVQLGHALKETGDLEGAGQAYRRSLAINGVSPDTHLQLGHLLKISGNPRDAADAYMTALELDTSLSDALMEIQDLVAKGVFVASDRYEAVVARIASSTVIASPPPVNNDPAGVALALSNLRRDGLDIKDHILFESAAARLRQLANAPAFAGSEDLGDMALVFDASDLVHYFRHSRTPTGIQRVQLEIISSIARIGSERVEICATFHHRWVRIPNELFLALGQLSSSGSDTRDPDWRAGVVRLELAIGGGKDYFFPRDACLINLGTSWHVDYLLKVRNAKRDSQIRFVPFVHDLIPIVRPQFVLSELTRDYVAWLSAVFDHADLFLTNSNATRTDLMAAAGHLGRTLNEADVVVIPLDARFNSPGTIDTARLSLQIRAALSQPFVLFVGTVEPRKNHMAAIDAWIDLLGEFGPRMPKLVCVGGRGWMNDEVFRRIDSDERLQRLVVFLHGVSDVELSACYDACLFTLFPSHYEGWGLPVTESLCHGKVPVLAVNSSLPEAGGPFAVYFETASHVSLVGALRTLIDDPAYRLRLEDRIKNEFQPRTWKALAEQVVEAVGTHFGDPHAPPARDGIPLVAKGSFYPFARNVQSHLQKGLVSGEVLRAGSRWFSPEDWGVWSMEASLELRLRLPETEQVRLYVGVQGLPSETAEFSLAVNGREQPSRVIRPGQTKWLSVVLDAQANAPVFIKVSADKLQDLALSTDGADSRVIGPGLVGFYTCAATDLIGRLAFTEALSMGDLRPGPLEGKDVVNSPEFEAGSQTPRLRSLVTAIR